MVSLTLPFEAVSGNTKLSRQCQLIKVLSSHQVVRSTYNSRPQPSACLRLNTSECGNISAIYLGADVPFLILEPERWRQWYRKRSVPPQPQFSAKLIKNQVALTSGVTVD